MTAEERFDRSLISAPLAVALREGPGLVTEEDIEDLGQEALVALWQAARGYPEGETTMPFGEYAAIQITGALREYQDRWYADQECAPMGACDEVAGESIFLLWPEA